MENTDRMRKLLDSMESKQRLTESFKASDDFHDSDGDFTKSELHSILRNSGQLEQMIDSDEPLPEWLQAKITQAKGMISGVLDYMSNETERDVEDDSGVEGVSTNQLDESAPHFMERKGGLILWQLGHYHYVITKGTQPFELVKSCPDCSAEEARAILDDLGEDEQLDEISDELANRTANARHDAVKSADRSNRDELMGTFNKFSKNQRLQHKRDIRQQKAGTKGQDPRTAEYQNAKPGQYFGDSVEPRGKIVDEGKNKNVHSPGVRELMDFCKSRTIEQDIYRIIVGSAPDYALSDKAIQQIRELAELEARFHHLNMREDTYEIIDIVINELQKEYGPDQQLDESADGKFKSKEEAIRYAQEEVKTERSPDEGIEIYAAPDGTFRVNHTMNYAGRRWLLDNGAEKLGTVRRKPINEVTVGNSETAFELQDKIKKLKHMVAKHEEKLASISNTHPDHWDLEHRTKVLKNRLAKAIEAHKAIEPGAYSECNQMNEGTWSTPDTPEKQRRLAKILSQPLHCDAATHSLYDYIGDDQLFDKLADWSEYCGRHDVKNDSANWVVIDWMKDHVDERPEFAAVLKMLGKGGQINELSKATLKDYTKKASGVGPKSAAATHFAASRTSPHSPHKDQLLKKADRRAHGVEYAMGQLEEKTELGGDDVMGYTGPSEYETNPYTAREVLQQARGWMEQGEDIATIRDIIMAMVDDGAVSASDAKRVLAKLHKERLSEKTELGEALSMRSALSNELSKAEPGSKLDKAIKHHNQMVRQFGEGTLDRAPTGYHFDKKGMIRLGDLNEKTELGEKAVSKAQQRFFGMAHAMQKGEMPKKGEAGEVAKSVSKQDVKDFASTKHKGLPEKVTDECTTSAGSVATAPMPFKKTTESAKPDADAPKAPDLPLLGGTKYNYGSHDGIYESTKGKPMSNSIYESLLKGYRETLLPEATAKKNLNESISITVSDEDAEALLQLLAMAGINTKGPEEVEVVVDEPLEENQPNWPTKPETMQDTPTLSAYSGGLNGPKSTGQSTTPILASQKNRQHAYENVELERNLFNLYQQVKGEE